MKTYVKVGILRSFYQSRWFHWKSTVEFLTKLRERVEKHGLILVEGGARRQDSVHAALSRIGQDSQPPEFVLIQDGARPFCSTELLERVLDGCRGRGSAIPVVPLTDTVRRIRYEACELIDRSELYAVQTPQGFRFRDLWEASLRALKEKWEVTDDASLLEKCGETLYPVQGESSNLKITKPEDLEWARWKCSRKKS